MLHYFDCSKPVLIQTDASSTGIGSCLLQEGHPVAYASRAFTDTETRYAQIEKELLAVVFACEKFSNYIYGQLTTVQTDHKPLQAIFCKPISDTTPRLQRMLLRLLKFQLNVVYIPGKDQYVADTLSRAYLCDNPTFAESEINSDIDVTVHSLVAETPISNRMLEVFRNATKNDVVLSNLRVLMQADDAVNKQTLSPELKVYAKFLPEIFEADGILFYNNKVIVPKELRPDMVKRIHEGHLGVEKCKALARGLLYWPGITKDIENTVARCSVCIAHRPSQQREPLMSHSVPNYAWQKVGADIFTLNGKDYLIIVDYYSKYPEVSTIEYKSASHVVEKFKSVFARHGIPEVLIADNNPFNSREMHKFAEEWNFAIITSSPNYAQSNGQAERAVQTVKGLFRKAFESGTDPHIALLQYRNAPVAGIDRSPAELLMNRSLRTRLSVVHRQPSQSDDRAKLTNCQIRQKQYYDRHAKPLSILHPGDVVRVRHNSEWVRGIVTAKHSTPRSYLVKTDLGLTLRRNRRQLLHTNEDPPVTSSPIDDHCYKPVEKQHGDDIPEPQTQTRSGRTVTLPVRFDDYVMTY